MKRSAFVTLLVLFMLPVVVLPLLPTADGFVAGKMRIGDIRAEIMTTHGAGCGCCPALWNGGIATTTADLSNVRLYDMADIITLDGGHYVMECVEIVPCIRVGRWLIGWRGVVKVQGDIIVYSAGKAYRFTRL